MLKIIGGLIVAWSVLDWGLSWMSIDLYNIIGIKVPDSIYSFTPLITGIIGGGVYSLGEDE